MKPLTRGKQTMEGQCWKPFGFALIFSYAFVKF